MTSATDNRTTELESLSKLKMAGRLRYWRGTIEIPEIELHAICDEIQAEYDNAVHALNKAAGNWAKADAELREMGEAMTDNRTTERVDHPPRVREAIDELMREKDAADNRTTELLRKLLDERGVEYEAYRDIKNRCITKWRTYHGAFVFFAVEEEGKLFVETASDTEHSAICTPEQAIAATLGAEYHRYEQAAIEAWESIKAWNERATHGTLTAEQVRKAIRKYAEDDSCYIFEVYGEMCGPIADELNAAMGGGTCKITATSTNNLMYPDYMTKWYELSCGHSLTLKGDEAPKWCAVCGKAVDE